MQNGGPLKSAALFGRTLSRMPKAGPALHARIRNTKRATFNIAKSLFYVYVLDDITMRGSVHSISQRNLIFVIFIQPVLTLANPGIYLSVLYYQPGKKNWAIFLPGW